MDSDRSFLSTFRHTKRPIRVLSRNSSTRGMQLPGGSRVTKGGKRRLAGRIAASGVLAGVIFLLPAGVAGHQDLGGDGVPAQESFPGSEPPQDAQLPPGQEALAEPEAVPGLGLTQDPVEATGTLAPSVTIQAFVRPEAERLRVLVRVPLGALREIEFPLRGPGYLDLDEADPALVAAARLWLADHFEVFEDGSRVGPALVEAARVSLPSDRSFASFDEAVANLFGPPIPSGTDLFWRQGLLDIALAYPIASEPSSLEVRPAWNHLGDRTTTMLRVQTVQGDERVLQFSGDPGTVRLDPRWYHVVGDFLRRGAVGFAENAHYPLFLLCLVMPFRRPFPLVGLIVSFSAGYTITLAASGFGLLPNVLWFPSLIGTLIALSVVLLALGNMVEVSFQRRWPAAFVFGAIHGFGFWFLFRESLQFAGSHAVPSLFGFTLGTVAAQVAVVAAAVPLMEFLFRKAVSERTGIILLSAVLGHSAWHWMTDRGSLLLQHQFQWPALDLFFVASAMRWFVLFLILAGVAWLLLGLFGRPERTAVRVGT